MKGGMIQGVLNLDTFYVCKEARKLERDSSTHTDGQIPPG